jgi:hypothetical protein
MKLEAAAAVASLAISNIESRVRRAPLDAIAETNAPTIESRIVSGKVSSTMPRGTRNRLTENLIWSAPRYCMKIASARPVNRYSAKLIVL